MMMENDFLNKAIADVKKASPTPQQGLPEPVFEMVTTLTPMVNVDLLIRDDTGRILLVWREDDICGCGWHIPGGIVRYKERMEDRLQKTAEKELGTRVAFDKVPIAINEVFVEQEIRGHFISFLYQCYLPSGYQLPQTARVEDNHLPGDMCWHDACPEQWVRGQKGIYASLFTAKNVYRDEADWPNVKTLFEKSNPLSEIRAKVKSGQCTFVFDIDGVVAQLDETLQYDRELPLAKTIDIINYLYSLGNEIILFTARGYKTGIDWREVTEAQMRDWGVHYHELKFGKPAATFYVDDKNMDLEFLYTLAEGLF